MKFLYLVSFIFLGLSAFSQKNFTLIKQSDSEIVLSFTQSIPAFQYSSIAGENYIDFNKSHKITSLEKGNPQLPRFGESILIPNTGATSVEVEFGAYEEFSSVLVAPSKGNLKRNVNPDEVPYIFSERYQQNQFYPANPVVANDPFILRTVRGQVISVNPYLYNPVTKTLRVYKNLKIKVYIDQNAKGINELIGKQTRPTDLNHYRDLFINQALNEKYTAVDDVGDMLIIGPDSYADSLKPLIVWKNQKGIKCEFKPSSETGTIASDIKSYLVDYYEQHPNLKYVILAGDNQDIPPFSYGTSSDGEALISDSYYGQLVGGDFYPEVFVGRLSGTSMQVALMVKRILAYEINPANGDWMTKALGLGSSQGAGYGDDDEADWQHLRGIRNQFLNFGYTSVYEFYDGSRGGDDAAGNPSSSIISPAVNSGIGLFNYTGHGDINTCISGNFSSSSINALTNVGMHPFVVSVACNNGTFNLGTCISETWLRANKNNEPTGAIAACGSSILMAWAPPMQTQDEMTALITRSYTDNVKTTLGGYFYNAQMSMLEQYPSDGPEVMKTWIFFGDPSVEFRSKTTGTLDIAYPACISTSTPQTISCYSDNEGAQITLTQDGQNIASGKVNNGKCDLNIQHMDIQKTIVLTATLPNYKALIDSIFITDAENCLTVYQVFPNPAENYLQINYKQQTLSTRYELFDMNGKLVLIHEDKSIYNDVTILDLKSVMNGLYVLKITDGDVQKIEKIVVY